MAAGASSWSHSRRSLPMKSRKASRKGAAWASLTRVRPEKARARHWVMAAASRRRQFQFGHDGGGQVEAGDGLLDFMVELREFEIVFTVGFGQAAAGGGGIHLALVFVMEDQVLEAEEFDGADAAVGAIIKMFDGGGHLAGKGFLDPFAFHRGGQAEQGQYGRRGRRLRGWRRRQTRGRYAPRCRASGRRSALRSDRSPASPGRGAGKAGQ